MESFDEEEYASIIEELKISGSEEEVAKYIRIEEEYKFEMEQILSAFRDANLKLDGLILEKQRFLNIDSNVILETLDQLINETKLSTRESYHTKK